MAEDQRNIPLNKLTAWDGNAFNLSPLFAALAAALEEEKKLTRTPR